MSYQVKHLITPIKCWKYSCLLGESPLVIIFAIIIFVLQYTNLTNPSLIFFRTKWWWILICFMWAWKIGFFDKDIQLWLLLYRTMGFICGTPMLPNNDESHIACLIVYEVAIYLTYVDKTTIEVCFLLFQLIAPFSQ